MALLDFKIERSRKNLIKWIFLKGMSLIYTGLIRIWLALYRYKLKAGWSAQVAVISVGNITLGGTGKTPMVDWLLSFLKKKGVTPAVLTRGYKAKRAEKTQILNQETSRIADWSRFGDEPWLLFQNHPDISLYISPDRIESARLAQTQADILILDDGMQHLRLNRDLEILLIDTVSGIGNGQVFPLGPLREPIHSLARADVVLYTKSNLVPSRTIKDRIRSYLRDDVRHFDSEYLPSKLLSSSGLPSILPSSLEDKKCLLFSGIGNPAGFTKTVRNTGALIQDHLIFDDHQTYSTRTINQLRQFVESVPYDYLVCTEKDWVKLAEWQDELPEIYRLRMEMQIDPDFVYFLNNWLSQRGPL
jgi:tetraacyldisaccharide 4'-kinase